MALLLTTPEARQGVARRRVLTNAGYAVLLVALILPRLHSGSPMWLDEALSVNIARLPLPDLLAALREDGSPPVYYVLLHAWMAVFGTGTGAVRALSSVFSVLALPVAYLVGRRLAGGRAAAPAVLLLAACPFAIRYATEARMYALVMLLTLFAMLAALRALERPTRLRLGLVAVAAGLLSLTHYWSLFFLAAGEVLLLAYARRERWRGPATKVAKAVPLGSLLFVPWLPSFLFQSQHTGTPWAAPPTWLDAVQTMLLWAGPDLWCLILFLVFAGLAGYAATRPEGRQLLLLGLGALALGLVASRLQGSGYAARYSAAMVVPVVLGTAVGVARLRPRLAQAACAVAAVLALAVTLFSSLRDPRTQAGETADLLSAQLRPDDIVVFCPDQLGPAVNRLLPPQVRQVVYPTLESPQRIDWVDYGYRNVTSSPSYFADRLNTSTTGAVWLVGNNHYRTYGTQCADLDYHLAALRGSGTVLQQRAETGEGQWVVAYPAIGGAPILSGVAAER